MEESRLTTTAKALKSHLVLFIVIFVVIDLFILSTLAFIARNGKTYSGVKWQNITPGQTTAKDLENTLGEPIKIQNNSHYYATTNQNRPAQVLVDNNTVKLIKEPVIGNEKGTLQNYIDQLGQPEKIFYGQDQYAAPGYFWGQKGIMVFGNPISGVILEIWYFPPTEASLFSESYPELKDQPESGHF